MPSATKENQAAQEQDTPETAAVDGSRAARMRQPSGIDLARAVAENNGVCVRPMAMRQIDKTTGRVDVIPVPCGSTDDSVCASCARRWVLLRMAQCRQGWHLDAEPDFTPDPPTDEQADLLETRADLFNAYQDCKTDGRDGELEDIAESVRLIDAELRALGMRGSLPPLEPRQKASRNRSTRRRQDAPNLPRLPVDKNRTVGSVFGGKYRPSLFLTLTLPSYGRIKDGAPVDPNTYDYRQAARDAVHFARLVDRFWQNLRRAVGWDVQYFSTVEPQKRAAAHLHAAIRGALPRKLVQQVVNATYHQVWWPPHDEMVYPGDTVPVWSAKHGAFADPDTGTALTTWDDALDGLDDEDEPAHVVRFGSQVDIKGVLGGTEEAGRHVGYLTKYLTKSISAAVEPDTDAQRRHAERLHAELAVTPCSPRCPVWLRYGIQPKGVKPNTIPGHCKGKAHQATSLGLAGRRVLVSRKWSGKSLADHKQDRHAFVRQLLLDVGLTPEDRDPNTVIWQTVAPGDTDVPPRDHLLLNLVAQRQRWKAQYAQAQLAAGLRPPDDCSATPTAA